MLPIGRGLHYILRFYYTIYVRLNTSAQGVPDRKSVCSIEQHPLFSPENPSLPPGLKAPINLQINILLYVHASLNHHHLLDLSYNISPIPQNRTP